MSNSTFETILLESCQSTMDEAKKYAQEKKRDHIFCVMTKNQTAGRGRGGSTWVQAEDNSKQEPDFLPLTLVIPTHILKVPMEWLSIMVGCAIYDALKQIEIFLKTTFPSLKEQKTVNQIFIKWPNDIITFPEGKKISGILCESSVINGKANEVFVGVGLNFFSNPAIENATNFFSSLFSSTLSEVHKQLTLNYFIKLLFAEIEEYLLHSRSISQLKHLALERFLPSGTYLSVNKGTMQGKFSTINENGALLLEGINEPIFSGDVAFKPTPALPAKNILNKVLINNQPNTEKRKSIGKGIIAIDFGNTRIHLASKNSCEEMKFVDLKYELDAATLKIELKAILENLLIDRTDVISIFYASVNTKEKTHGELENLTNFLKKIFPEIKFTQFQVNESVVFEKMSMMGDFSIERMGTDRALKFYFACNEAKKIQKNVLVFSFGTAVTCEGVSKEGFILENFVTPGIQMSFNALHDYTALLPSLTANSELFSPEGKKWNQEIYLQRGVFMSVVGTVITTAQLHKPCVCYLSGGNGEEIAAIVNHLRHKIDLAIEIKLVNNIETKMLLQIASTLSQKPTIINPLLSSLTLRQEPISKPIPNSAEELKQELLGGARSTKIILNSMIKSRIKAKENRNAILKEEDFRKIGARIENSNEDRLDLYMAQKFKFHSREEWRERILSSEVMIENNAPQETSRARKPSLIKVKPTYKIKNFDQIWLFHPPEYEPEFLDTIHVIYDNKDICVFSKPPNLVVHSAGLYLKNTFIEHIAKMGYENCSPVHRIDRETSGLLICSRKTETRKILSDAFRNSQVKKMYLAVTKGTRELPEKFMVNLPIGEPENSLIRLKLWVNGKNAQPASTFFAKLSSIDDYTLFACLPITGRTNQIRIHLAAIGHWIVGDKMYFENENVFIEFYEKGFTQWVHEQVIFPRHMLHNTGIMFDPALKIDPLSYEPIICPIPEDMVEFPIVKELMQRTSSLSFSSQEEQIQALRKIFLELHKENFEEEIIIS